MDSKRKNLSLAKSPGQKSGSSPKTQPQKAVADSWDEDVESSGSDTDTGNGALASKKSPVPDPPPPTPSSPNSSFPSWDSYSPGRFEANLDGTADEDRRRPEKSTAAAGRLIAAGLGMRAPKKTDEQKAYDRAVKENEMKRRDKEREARAKEAEDNQKAKAAMWDA